MYLKVVFNLPIDKILTYKKPNEINESLVGCRVVATIKGKPNKGIVIEETQILDGDYTPLPIKTRIDNFPICSDKEFLLAKWMSKYYHCSYGEALFASLPVGNPSKKEKKIKPIDTKQKPYLKLNDEQSLALNKIIENIESKEKKTFLLHGVTGSGKTEVYLQAIKKVVDLDKQAIIILPEISLTPQTIKKFAERFQGKIAVIHSKLSPTAKYKYWQMIKNNEIKIIIGARSAIFSPTVNLGIIVIDEEHETSYKSTDTPRYHTRQIAFYKKEKENATLLLGSATPAIETYYYAKETNIIELLTLKKRATSINMPEVKILDLKKEKKSNIFNMMTEKLVEEINKKLENKEQVILFLNRKGYAPIVSCSHCSKVLECPNCSVSLTYHKNKNTVVCHYCGYRQFLTKTCEECNIGNLEIIGSGTEKVEENLNILFPNAKIERIDQEVANTTKSYEKIFKSFSDREIDILVGTQMIAKGLDFPNVTLVGVLLADMSLHIQDFRSAERTFNLITQVAGRSGRGEKKGIVYIQTYSPNHFSITCAQNHNYIDFYNIEIEKRKRSNYPPFSRLVRIVVRGEIENKVQSDILLISDLLANITFGKDVEIVGTVPCTISKLNKYYRWNILIKVKNHNILNDFFYKLKTTFIPQKGNYIEIDIDPINMM